MLDTFPISLFVNSTVSHTQLNAFRILCFSLTFLLSIDRWLASSVFTKDFIGDHTRHPNVKAGKKQEQQQQEQEIAGIKILFSDSSEDAYLEIFICTLKNKDQLYFHSDQDSLPCFCFPLLLFVSDR